MLDDCRFHICGSRKLQNCLARPRTEARRRGEPPPLFLRPSTQKWILTADEELETTGRRHGGLKGTVCLRTPTAPFQAGIPFADCTILSPKRNIPKWVPAAEGMLQFG